MVKVSDFMNKRKKMPFRAISIVYPPKELHTFMMLHGSGRVSKADKRKRELAIPLFIMPVLLAHCTLLNKSKRSRLSLSYFSPGCHKKAFELIDCLGFYLLKSQCTKPLQLSYYFYGADLEFFQCCEPLSFYLSLF